MDIHDSAHFALDHDGPAHSVVVVEDDEVDVDVDAYAAEHATELITASIRANVAARAAQLAQLGQYVDTDGVGVGGGAGDIAAAEDTEHMHGHAHAHDNGHDSAEIEPEHEAEAEAEAEYRAQTSQPPPPHSSEVMALYGRTVRDEDAPHPELLEFETRADFEPWLENELSWCHYVQRRVTTPEKRAEERVRGRERAHQRLLASLPADEAAALPPLKRRRRMRTSTVDKKTTYTCHHAGTYATRHSTTVPSDKLRMKTKKSVKCGCNSRIVCNEMATGEVNVAFYWKHVGHDPYQSAEIESTRLPKVVDEWVVAQLEAGRHPDEIRKLLEPDEERKAEYLARLAEDPEYSEPDMPPALAFAMRIKYPDIYNRYRKFHGPLRGASRSQNDHAEHAEMGTDVQGEVPGEGGHGAGQGHASGGMGVHAQEVAEAGVQMHEDHGLAGMDPTLAMAHSHGAGAPIEHEHVERLADHVHSHAHAHVGGLGHGAPHPLSARVEDETTLDGQFGDAGGVSHEHEHEHGLNGDDADADADAEAEAPQDEASVTASLVNVLKRAHEAATAAAGQTGAEADAHGRVEGHATAATDAHGHASVGGVDMGVPLAMSMDMGLGGGTTTGSGLHSHSHSHTQAGIDGEHHVDLGAPPAHAHATSNTDADADADAAQAALLHAHMGHVDAEHFYDDDGQMNIQMTEELEKLANEITSHWRQ